jgi:Helicase conserved C-terminal domain
VIDFDLDRTVLASPRFQAILRRLATDTIRIDLPVSHDRNGDQPIDWQFAFLCSSALTSSRLDAAQDAVLRVARACLTLDVDRSRREAAAVLLERLGNRPSLELAASRGLVELDAWTAVPAPLQLDVIRRRLELTIPVEGRDSIIANPFQRDFWDAASAAGWVSISAPTSAGKSYIVKGWIEDRARTLERFQGVYLVPTRALIDEVSADFRQDLGESVAIHTLPWDALVGQANTEVFVLTQERFHLLQQRLPAFAPDMIFVDEAQKFGDGTRGVLLAQVLDEAVKRAPGSQVIFAIPLASNPEMLLDDAPSFVVRQSLVSDLVTVNQNLLWADQVWGRPRLWDIQHVDGEVVTHIGQVELAARPSPDSKRLPFVAVALGRTQPGNVVYANGAADAEKTARQIFELLGEDANMTDSADIAALRELAIASVHRQYALATVVTRGIGFHYGNMPQLLRSEIERLFREGVLRYLVCTSTLLEGVNLPCRNLFARGPRRGNNRPMSPPDFWNLAGRAGRWGMEFQGNIVCVDASDVAIWPNPPGVRVKEPLNRTSDRVLARSGELLTYIEAGTPVAMAKANPDFEAVFSLLATRILQGRPLASVVGFAVADEDALARIEQAVDSALAGLHLPPPLIDRHAGISPLSMQRLYDYFGTVADIDALRLAPPESRDAAQSYVRALALVDEFLGGTIGPTPGRQFQLAILINQWMQGRPLSVLINDRVQYRRRAGHLDLASDIRAVMADVEQYARFQAPKYLACYADVLRVFLEANGLETRDEGTLDISVMLELGVSRPTDVSLMSLGLSRTTTTALSAYIVPDALNPTQAAQWLLEHDWESLPLPALVKREIRRRLGVRNLVT